MSNNLVQYIPWMTLSRVREAGGPLIGALLRAAVCPLPFNVSWLLPAAKAMRPFELSLHLSTLPCRQPTSVAAQPLIHK